jgi:hypothetical protein
MIPAIALILLAFFIVSSLHPRELPPIGNWFSGPNRMTDAWLSRPANLRSDHNANAVRHPAMASPVRSIRDRTLRL